MKQRLKSYKFWVAFSAAVIIFAKALGEMFGFGVDDKALESVILGFCGVLVVCGIVDKPKNDVESTKDDGAENQNEDKKE